MAPLSAEAAGVAAAAAAVVEQQRQPAAAQLDLSRGQLVAERCQSVAWSALQVDESVEALLHGTCLWHGHELDQSSQSFKLVGKRRMDLVQGVLKEIGKGKKKQNN